VRRPTSTLMHEHVRVVLLAAGTLCTASAGAQRAAERVVFQPYLFETTDQSQQVMAEWGTLTVPERHTRPDGRRIQLALVRFRSTAKQPGPPIIWLAGGPGLDAIDAARANVPHGYAREAATLKLYLALRELGDVIMFDQRGTGYSRPSLKCKEPGRPLPLDSVTTPADLLAANGLGAHQGDRDQGEPDKRGGKPPRRLVLDEVRGGRHEEAHCGPRFHPKLPSITGE